MKINQWIVFILIVTGLALSACGPASTKTEKVQPFQLVPIEGTDLKQVILTEKAAQRLGIQTAVVGDEQVSRNQVLQGKVIASPQSKTIVKAPASGTVLAPIDASVPVTGMPVSAGQIVFRLAPLAALSAENTGQSVMNIEVPADTVLLRMLVSPGQIVEAGQLLFEIADTSKVWIRVPLRESELARIDRSQDANILLIQSNDADEGLVADAIDDVGDIESDVDEPGDTDFALYYGVDNANHGLTLGQHVQVKLALAGSGKLQKVIPYAAVIYDTEGNTWVYTNPEPLIYVRQPVVIDYIQDDRVILMEGLESGTAVVIVGAPELLGAELGVSK